MSVLQVALRFGVFGVIVAGGIMFYNYCKREEQIQAENLSRKKRRDEPYVLNVLDRCPICLDRFAEDENSRRILLPNCGHQLDNKCFKELIDRNYKKCPMCRNPF